MPNLKAKYIIDENGDRVAPITYIDAVRNSSGDSLSDLMVPEKLGSGIGTCSTSSGTALTVSLTDYDLVQNGFVAVTFANDVPANATLNVNGKGAKPIIYKGSAITADVIKADDTVMFAYDGTNYIVTSLGGGGGTIVWPEFVTIQLTQSGGSDSDLIGATVVVTNDDTSAVILSTTWHGSNITVRVDEGVDYTVTVGDVSGLAIKQHTQSYTAESWFSRMIEFSYVGNFVDMGLPSGVLWARTNIYAKTANGFAASEYQYEGSIFSFGNVLACDPTNSANFTQAVYDNQPGSQLTGNIPVSSTYDAARAICGYPWRMPTKAEADELLANCDFVDSNGNVIPSTTADKGVTINSIKGVMLKSKINGNTIFFAACGYNIGSGWQDKANRARYRLSTVYSNGSAYEFLYDPNSALRTGIEARFYGFFIRPVV